MNSWDTKQFECQKCKGSGTYRWPAFVRGRQVWREGTCYPCQGKGWVSRRDTMRTQAYWSHRAVEG